MTKINFSQNLDADRITGKTYVPVDAIQCLNVLFRPMSVVIRVQVVFPVLRGDALSHECLHVVLDIGKENIQSAECPLCVPTPSTKMLASRTHTPKLTNVEQKVSSFVIRNSTIRFIWILSIIKVDLQALILWLGLVPLQIIV